MNIFGLSITKQTDITLFYKKVDEILSNPKNTLHDIKKYSVTMSLNKMIRKDSYFCIYTIKNIAKIYNIDICKERIYVYSNFHCINWIDIDLEFKDALIAMIFDDFRSIFIEKKITEDKISE